jgi:hypothetical protein
MKSKSNSTSACSNAGLAFVCKASLRICACFFVLAALASAQHKDFDSPEGWAMKRFASATLLTGLQPPESAEDRRFGSLTIGFEMGWLPALDAGQARVGFSGSKVEDLNKSPIFARPVVRVGLPAKFTGIFAFAAPIRVWDVAPTLAAFGLERPLVERGPWTIGWRGYGQVGHANSSFTCPQRALAFPPGSAGNPAGCVAFSDDTATLRYIGTEGQVSYRIPRWPRLTLHATAGVNHIQGRFQVNSQRVKGLDHTRLWTGGETFSTTGGASYTLTKRAALTVDTFYTPLWVVRETNGPRTNDGLFNVRAMLSYRLR